MHALPDTFHRFCHAMLRRLHRFGRWLLDLRYGRAGAVAAHVIRFMS